MAEVWPSIIKPATVDFALAPMGAYGPAATSGVQQAVATDAGYWVASLSDIPLRTADQIREWRWLTTVAQGGLRDIIVGPFDCRQAPRPLPGPGFDYAGLGTSFSDDALFSDGVGFESVNYVRVWLYADAALRATHLVVDIERAGPIRRGMYFSIDNRLHMVASEPAILIAGGDLGAGARLEFDISPPLRRATNSGWPVEFGAPRATMRLPKGLQGRAAITRGQRADVSIELVESFDGL